MRFDNGEEYALKTFQDFCDLKELNREMIAPYNPPHNSVAKRMNKHFKKRSIVGCAMLIFLMGFGLRHELQLFIFSIGLQTRFYIQRFLKRFGQENHPLTSI